MPRRATTFVQPEVAPPHPKLLCGISSRSTRYSGRMVPLEDRPPTVFGGGSRPSFTAPEEASVLTRPMSTLLSPSMMSWLGFSAIAGDAITPPAIASPAIIITCFNMSALPGVFFITLSHVITGGSVNLAFHTHPFRRAFSNRVCSQFSHVKFQKARDCSCNSFAFAYS